MGNLNLEKTYDDFHASVGFSETYSEKDLKDAFMFGATSVVSHMTEDVAEMEQDEAVEAINRMTEQVSEYWASEEDALNRSDYEENK